MKTTEERELRAKAAALVLEWATGREPPFKGETKEEFAAVITAADVVADEARHRLMQWVTAGRRAGMSWTEIGETLGISKQAAQQRFGGAGDPADTVDEGRVVVRLGATAFNEMQILEREGAKGNELVQIGVLQLVFRPTRRRWTYRRVVAVSPKPLAAAQAAGWTFVASWFPFHYFKRPVATGEE